MNTLCLTESQAEIMAQLSRRTLSYFYPEGTIYKSEDDPEPYETDMFSIVRSVFRQMLKETIPEGDVVNRLIESGFTVSEGKLNFKPDALETFHKELDHKLGEEVVDRIAEDTHKIINNIYVTSKEVAAKKIKAEVSIKGADKATIDILSDANNFFIRNTYNAHLVDAVNEKAIEVINRGLGAEELGLVLKDELSELIGTKSDFYFRVLANDVINRARTFAQVIQYREVGITTYEWVTMADERVCPICAYMDGRIFRIETAGEIVQEIIDFGIPENAGQVEEFKQIKPWLGFDPQRALAGNSAIFLQQGDRRTFLPNSNFRFDSAGIAFPLANPKSREDNTRLEDLHTILPPLHGMCRCTTVVSEESIREYLGEQELVNFETSPYEPISREKLIDRSNLELRELAKERGIKYFRVMNKQELITVLSNPSKAIEIGKIARQRWQKQGPQVPPRTDIKKLADELKEKPVSELMRIAQEKGIKNFRVMRKEELISVLSDPSKYDQIQETVKQRIREARGQPGAKPGTTKADELGLEDVAERKKNAIDTILTNAETKIDFISNEEFRKKLKPWLKDFELDVLEKAVEKNLKISLYRDDHSVPWRGTADNFSGIYWNEKHQLGLVYRTGGYRRMTFDHEMGHFIDHEHPASWDIKRKYILDEFKREQKIANELVPKEDQWLPWEAKWKLIKRADDIVSEYGMRNEGEFFAESVMIYMYKSPFNKLQRVAPDIYKAFKDKIFRREFKT
ncbi:MAG: Rho termination factor N-terminal domain-containing protein [Elusimicrobiota bacterium]